MLMDHSYNDHLPNLFTAIHDQHEDFYNYLFTARFRNKYGYFNVDDVGHLNKNPKTKNGHRR